MVIGRCCAALQPTLASATIDLSVKSCSCAICGFLTAYLVKKHKFWLLNMVYPAVEAALQSALANQQYESISAILDTAELEVQYSLMNLVLYQFSHPPQSCCCNLAVY